MAKPVKASEVVPVGEDRAKRQERERKAAIRSVAVSKNKRTAFPELDTGLRTQGGHRDAK